MRIRALLLFFILSCALTFAQTKLPAPPEGKTLLIVPFENASKVPGIEWIGEAFPEVLSERMASPTLLTIERDERVYAFDRLGIPANVRPSRATLYRIGREMDVDYMVIGRYTFDGRAFTASAQLLEMEKLKLSPEIRESGPLTTLIDIQTSLAWNLLRNLNSNLGVSRVEFVRNADPIRLDAFENYIRGVIATTRQEKIRFFRRAISLNSDYSRAQLELGKTYFDAKDYETAMGWFARVNKDTPQWRKANFYLGLSAYYKGDFERAEKAFSAVAAQLPLTEVTNNLGVAAARLGKDTAAGYFRRTVETDPNDPDYHFNLAVTLYKVGDFTGATRHLRETLALRANDAEARSLLENLGANVNTTATPVSAQPAAPAGRPSPLERVKTTYDETSFRQLAYELQTKSERTMAGATPRRHASFHVERGRELLSQGFLADAEREYREAILLDPTNAAAHAGLGNVLLAGEDVNGARGEALSSLRLQASAEAHLLLARIAVKENNLASAQESVQRALQLEPNNRAARDLQRELSGKQSQ